MDAAALTAKLKKVPPAGWVVLAGGAFVGYRWYSGRQVTPAPLPDGTEGDLVTDPGPLGYLSGTGGATTTGDAPVSSKPSFDSNAEWASAAIDTLVARGFSAGFAQTAITKALDGEPLSLSEKAAVSLALALLGVSPPAGMPPLNSDPAPAPGGGNTPPATTVKGPAVRKAAGKPLISANTKATTGRWTWEQIMRDFYSATPAAGSAQSHAAVAQLKTANMFRVIPKGQKNAGKKLDGWGGWDTVGGNVTVSLPAVLYW